MIIVQFSKVRYADMTIKRKELGKSRRHNGQT